MPTVYKVVSIINGKYYSFSANWKKYGVEYKLKETTKPVVPKSPLMAFSSIEYARSFKYIYSLTPQFSTILECSAELFESEVINLQIATSNLATIEDVEAFWNSADTLYMPESPPKGTVFCSSIIPLKILI